MKTPSPKSLALQLAEKYYALNPNERRPGMDWQDLERIFGNWLSNLRTNPSSAIATAIWCGKVTSAFFAVFGEKCPRKVADMATRAQELLDAPAPGVLVKA